MNKILRIINEEINELFDQNGSAKPEIIKNNNVNGNIATTYRFNTKSGNEYETHFIKSKISNTTILYDIGNDYGYMLCDFLNIECNDDLIDAIDVAFTSKDNINFEDNTNKYETIEVMNEVAEMTKLFINDNPSINIYIASGSEKIRNRIYLALHKNKFSNNFEVFEGETNNYDTPTFYFINKKILHYR